MRDDAANDDGENIYEILNMQQNEYSWLMFVNEIVVSWLAAFVETSLKWSRYMSSPRLFRMCLYAYEQFMFILCEIFRILKIPS